MQDDAVLERITEICLTMPEAVIDDSHAPHRSFKIGKKNFGWYVENEHGDGRIGLIVRVEPGENEQLVASDSTRFGLPKYVARYGWVTYYLDLPDQPVDWAELDELVRDSYRMQAPRRLKHHLD
jgi:hypothetical protein